MNWDRFILIAKSRGGNPENFRARGTESTG
jgi:hypothetical protein